MNELTTQCRAHNRHGERCKRFCGPGHVVCRMHGAAAPQTKRRALQRLALLTEDAIDRLAACLTSGPACPTCGRADNDRDPVVLKAAQIVLDRVGLGPQARLTVEAVPTGLDLAELSDEELAQEAERLAHEIRSGAVGVIDVAAEEVE